MFTPRLNIFILDLDPNPNPFPNPTLHVRETREQNYNLLKGIRKYNVPYLPIMSFKISNVFESCSWVELNYISVNCGEIVTAIAEWTLERNKKILKQISKGSFKVQTHRTRFDNATQFFDFHWPITLMLHGKKRRARCSTGLNNVLLPTLFIAVNNIEQCCWAWIGCNNIVQCCWQLWTMWAAKHCSIRFSSVLHRPERFYTCGLNFPNI
jgi:hypothetical protein